MKLINTSVHGILVCEREGKRELDKYIKSKSLFCIIILSENLIFCVNGTHSIPQFLSFMDLCVSFQGCVIFLMQVSSYPCV